MQRWIGPVLFLVACGEAAPPQDGTWALHRLNRREHERSLQTLTSAPLPFGRDLPEDERARGFDNQTDALHLSPLHLELSLRAAERAAQVLSPAPPSLRLEGTTLRAELGARYHELGWRFRGGTLVVPLPQLGPGHYRVALRLIHLGAGTTGPITASLPSGSSELTATPEGTITTHNLMLTSTRAPELELQHPGGEDVVLDWIRIDGPAGPDALPAERLDEAVAAVWSLADRAYRRPLAEAERLRLAQVVQRAYQNGAPLARAQALGIQAVLLSPYFLFRVEAPGPDGQTVDDATFAARLASFLHADLPDAALRALADGGALADPEVRAAEVARLLDDPKVEGLVVGFGDQWLNGRALAQVHLDPELFPEATPELFASALAEERAFLAALIAEDRPLAAVVDADFAFVDRQLAKLYGFGPDEAQPTRTPIPAGEPRRGVLGQVAFSLVTAHPTRTSPVRRGHFVLSQLLCTPPPPPPPAVAALPDTPGLGTARERAMAHRSRPECAGCHQAIDPIGLALEPLDALGRWRTTDEGRPIDARGALLDGTPFDGPAELSAVLAARPELTRCITQQLAGYALGRGLREAEGPEWTEWARSPGWRQLITQIALSPAFAGRGGGEW